LRSLDRSLIGSALRLDSRDRVRAVRAFAWLIGSAAALRLVPYATLMRAVSRIPASRSAGAAMTPAECADAVRRAARALPSARCLPRAVAGYCLLRRAGRTPILTLGARFDVDHRFDAHAWVECDGIMAVCADGAELYAPLIAAERRDA
jgi:hypothetical protein